jgi:hypothetical protein
VTNIDESKFAHAAPGFIVVDFGLRDGRDIVVLRVIERDFSEPVFEMELLWRAGESVVLIDPETL